MLHDRDIICISSIDWDFVWQGHQEIMSAFANNGNRVLYIENTGVRSPRLSDIGRIRHRLVNWRKGLRGIRQENKNLFICSPVILPFPYSRIAKVINRFLLLNTIKVWMKAIDFKDPVIWTFLPTSISTDIIDTIDHAAAVYYCIAEFAELAGSSKKINRSEIELLSRCDLVFAQGEKIRERCARHNANVHIFPFGVKTDVFLKSAGELEVPDDIKPIPRPVIGYIGGIHRHMNFKLLQRLAAEDPGTSLVLVGPVQTDAAELLKQYKNVYFLGKKDHRELPAYIDNFDLCLIPYLISEYTKTVYPTKLNEYLMRGKTVLSTPLPEVTRYVETFGDVAAIAKDDDDFLKKARSLVRMPFDPARAKRSVEIAGHNSWDTRIEEMSVLIERAIAEKQKESAGRWRDNFSGMLKRAKGKIVTVATALAVSYLLIFHTPCLWWLAEPLKVSDPLAHADAIMVLGGGVGESGRPAQGYEERVKYANELYKAGYASHVVFSSGFTYVFQEADVMKAVAVSLGIPAGDILLEKQATNTYENVANCLAIARENGWRRIIFVSSPYHMLRLKLTALKAGTSGSDLICSPIPRSIFYGTGDSVTVAQIKAILHEYLGILYYWFKGYV